MAENPGNCDVTRLIQAASASDRDAADQLLAMVYEQLRKLAQQRMSEERPDHTLQATALVHEAYLRVVGNADIQWQGRGHFFAAAAEAMRRILVERARRKAGPRQGGRHRRLDFDQLDVAADAASDLLPLDDALGELEKHDPQAATLVKLRYFAGMGHQEAAEALGISRGAADRLWTLAKAWLFQRLSDQ